MCVMDNGTYNADNGNNIPKWDDITTISDDKLVCQQCKQDILNNIAGG